MYNSLRNVVISFSASILLLAGLSFSAYQEVNNVIDYAESEETKRKIVEKTQSLVQVLHEMDNASLMFFVTRQKNTLINFDAGTQKRTRIIDHLCQLAKGDSALIKKLDVIKEDFNRKEMLARGNISDIQSKHQLDSLVFHQNVEQSIQLHKKIQLFKTRQEQLLGEDAKRKDEHEKNIRSKMLMWAIVTVLLLVISFGLVFVELRKRITFQNELEKTIEELKRSNSELEQFAYVASHDIQEPLRKIRAFSDMLLLRQRHNLTDDGKATLQKIALSAERLQNLIRDLLAFSRLVNANNQVIENLSLTEVVQEVLKDLSMLVLEKKAVVNLDNLPQINGVKYQFNQLFLNLISNALKFHQKNEVPHISIKYALKPGNLIVSIPDIKTNQLYHEIAIIDNGIGFEQEYAEKIFMIFQRLHARTEFEGTGIGLAICKRVVTNHQGHIKAESVPNHGTTFTIYLPTNRKEE